MFLCVQAFLYFYLKYSNIITNINVADAAITAWSSPGTADGGAEGDITLATIAENSKAVGDTIFTATATASGTVVYALISSTGSVGAIDAATGIVTLAAGKALDYETSIPYEFLIS